MTHVFNTKEAKLLGVHAAIILQNMRFWIGKNKANQTNIHKVNEIDYPELKDQYRHFTYNSISAYNELFDYLSAKQIRTAIDKLCNEGILIKGNYNKMKADRTNWYAFRDEKHILNEVGTTFAQMGEWFAPQGEGIAQEGEPIPDVNSNVNSDFNNCLPTPEIFKNENEISLIKTEEERKKVAPKKENKPQPQKFKVPKYESVSFTLDQMRALEERFGSDTEWIIKTLHNYKMSSGKKYKSDYHAIFTWVIDKYLKEKKPQKIGSMNVSNMPKYDFENIPDPLKDFR
jgi:hypothetical protein